MADVIHLFARVFIRGSIHVVTGLHIGGSDSGITIGQYRPVIVDQLSGRPYIPGSSLKGKMRSLLEKSLALPLLKHAGVDHMHTVEMTGEDTMENRREAVKRYRASPVAQIFGVPASSFNAPTRLVVRDVLLKGEPANELLAAKTDLPFTELKTEVSIDRVTSAANPRTIERIPAGAEFEGMEIVFNIYQYFDRDDKVNSLKRPDPFDLTNDINLFSNVLYGMALLEDDYLGGQGSRGSGQIEFGKLTVSVKRSDSYASEHWLLNTNSAPRSLAALIDDHESLKAELTAYLGA